MRLTPCRCHPAAHDPGVLADLPATGEPEVLEQLDRRAEQEPTLRLTPGGHLGDGLDEPTAALRDLLDGTLERGARDT